MADLRHAGWGVAALLAVGTAPVGAARAQEPAAVAPVDSARGATPLLERRHWYALAGMAAATAALLPVDEQITIALRSEERQRSGAWRTSMRAADVYGTPIAYAAGPALLATGSVFGNERVADVGGHITEAYAAATVAALVVKGISGRGRPYWPRWSSSSDFKLGRGFPRRERYSSFPSGHATGAFVFATVISAETSHWWPQHARLVTAVAYGGAVADGVSRVYRDTHWPSDVAAGALIGTLSGLLIVRRAHRHESASDEGNARHRATAAGGWIVQPSAAGQWRVGWSATF